MQRLAKCIECMIWKRIFTNKPNRAGVSAKIFEIDTRRDIDVTRPRLWAKSRDETETWRRRDQDEIRDFWNQMFKKFSNFLKLMLDNGHSEKFPNIWNRPRFFYTSYSSLTCNFVCFSFGIKLYKNVFFWFQKINVEVSYLSYQLPLLGLSKYRHYRQTILANWYRQLYSGVAKVPYALRQEIFLLYPSIKTTEFWSEK